MFQSLTKNHILQIVDLLASDLLKRAQAQDIDIELCQSAKDFLLDKGYDVKFGARPLKRAIQRYMEDPLAEAILSQDISEGDHVKVRYVHPGSELTFDITKATVKRKSAAPGKTSAK